MISWPRKRGRRGGKERGRGGGGEKERGGRRKGVRNEEEDEGEGEEEETAEEANDQRPRGIPSTSLQLGTCPEITGKAL